MNETHVERTYVEADVLLAYANELRDQGCRLIQICATTVGDHFEVTYTFGKDLEMLNVFVKVRPGGHVPSVSRAFPSAYVFENEMSDLFGIPVDDMSLDYHGRFYALPEKYPMATIAHVAPDGQVIRDGSLADVADAEAERAEKDAASKAREAAAASVASATATAATPAGAAPSDSVPPANTTTPKEA